MGDHAQKIERFAQVAIEEGLHMRPAMRLVDRASRFTCEITLSYNNTSVDGKSIMQVTMLAAAKGARILIVAEGPDAAQAAEAVAHILENVE